MLLIQECSKKVGAADEDTVYEAQQMSKTAGACHVLIPARCICAGTRVKFSLPGKRKGKKKENSTLTPAGMKRIPHSRTALRGFRVTLSPCVRRSQSWAVEHVVILP